MFNEWGELMGFLREVRIPPHFLAVFECPFLPIAIRDGPLRAESGRL